MFPHAGVVKMRRGETAKYVQLLGNMGDLYRAFELFSGRLASQYGPRSILLGIMLISRYP